MPAAGILGWKRSKYQRPILHISKSPETPRKLFSEYIKNIERKKYQRRATHQARGWGRALPPWARPHASWAPWWPSDAHLLLYEVFRPKKNHKQAFRTRLRRHEAEPWQNQSRAPAELFCRGNHRHRHHQRSSHREGANLHQHLHQHHLLSNPSSSLVSNLCPKASDWYLWVTSVDYSLQLMLVGLFGGRSYVQILYAY